VAISRDGSKLVGAVMEHVEKGDFDAAAAAARETPQLCKSCHDLYKPRLAR
jgi:cytochrome c556